LGSFGPIDMFPFLGARRGKSATLDVIREIADSRRLLNVDRERSTFGLDRRSVALTFSPDRAKIR
jgi:hypothetical protein